MAASEGVAVDLVGIILARLADMDEVDVERDWDRATLLRLVAFEVADVDMER